MNQMVEARGEGSWINAMKYDPSKQQLDFEVGNVEIVQVGSKDYISSSGMSKHVKCSVGILDENPHIEFILLDLEGKVVNHLTE